MAREDNLPSQPADTQQSSADSINPDYDLQRLCQALDEIDALDDGEPATRFFLRARAQWASGRRVQPIRCMDEAIRIAPKNPMFRRQRANYLIQLGEWAEALYDCEVWVRWRPSEALAYCARGRCYAFYDNYLRAQEDYSKAIEINPTVALFYKLRSVAFQRSGWTCDADRDEELAEALEAKPAD